MNYPTARHRIFRSKRVMLTATLILLASTLFTLGEAANDTDSGIKGSSSVIDTSNHSTVEQVYKPGGKLQIGYYDLLSQKKEVYDINLVFTPDGILSSVVNPNDIRFMSKGKLERTTRAGRADTYHYATIFYHNPDPSSMFDGEADYLTHNDIWVKPLVVNGQLLVMVQNGTILLNNLPDGKPSIEPEAEH